MGKPARATLKGFTLSLLTACVLAELQIVPPSPRIRKSGTAYTAAVVEFAPTESATDPPSLIYTTNLGEFNAFVTEAKTQGADIIVFPEYGLTGTVPSDNRKMARDYSQIVPDPQQHSVPCDTFGLSIEQEAVRRLSCMARDNALYLVANMLERDPCEGCASDDMLLFNTNVAFDRSGKVVARYRKFNLFAEFALNQTTEPDFSYFDADFGARFGLITCFDLMFERPAVTLVEEHGVTDIIFPTAWIQELPFLTAVQAQAAWSYGMGVNFLSAGYNRPEYGHTGSGIYGGLELGALETVMSQGPESKLLIASYPGAGEVAKKLPGDTEAVFPPPSTRDLYTSKDILDDYESAVLENTLATTLQTSVRHGHVLCTVNYKLRKLAGTFHYHVLAFDGIRTHAGGRYISKLQVCALVACSSDAKTSCADGFDTSLYSQQTEFETLTVSGTFDTSRLWPNTLLSTSINPINVNQFKFEKFNITAGHEGSLSLLTPMSAVHTFGLYTHDYEPYNAGTGLAAMLLILVLALASLFVFN